jgi:hypothetical protein
MALVRIIDLYEEKVVAKIKTKLASMGTIGSLPWGIFKYEEIIETMLATGQKSVDCLIRVGDLFSDPLYNRTLNINYRKTTDNIESSGGFSEQAAGHITVFRRPDGKLVVTQGNHRVTMKYASCLDPDAYIKAELHIHDIDADESQMIKKEAYNHHVDCNNRASQTTDDRFRSALRSGASWAENLHWYVQPFGISIAGTNQNGKFGTTSYAKIAEARNLDESSCSRYLKAFTDNVVTEKEVLGFATFSATFFLRNFRESIKYVDDMNSLDSVAGFIDYIYNRRFEWSRGFCKNVTQQQLTTGSNKIKGHEIGVARLVSLYNEYCEKIISAKIPSANNNAIGYSSKEYRHFIDNTNVDLRHRVDEISKKLF